MSTPSSAGSSGTDNPQRSERKAGSTPISTPVSTPASTPVSTRKSTSKGQLSSMQIVFGAILAISLLLAINFSGRIAAGRSIEGQRQLLERDIETLQARATALRSELNYYNSDAFVEQWARGEGKMVKQNEILVVPVPGQTTPQPTPTPSTVVIQRPEDEPENWQLWWQLFFDAPPGQSAQR